MGLITLLASAGAEGSEHTYTAFYIVGGVFAAFAVLISVVGFARTGFPGGNGPARAVMALGVLLMAATMSTVMIVSS